MDAAGPPPAGLADLMALGSVQALHSSVIPLRLAPQRSFWLQSRALPTNVCDKAVL
jgi:hypothetical protein